MPKRFMYLVIASLLAGVPVTSTPGHAAPATDDCLNAPNRQPPDGSHWYYRVDRTTDRKCWYLGAEGEKVRSVARRPERHRTPATQPNPTAASAPPAAASPAAPPVAPQRAAAAPLQAAETTAQTTPDVAPPTEQRAVTAPPPVERAATWPDPTQAVDTGAVSAATIGAATITAASTESAAATQPAELQDSPARDRDRSPAAGSNEPIAAPASDPRLLLALLAVAVLLSGIIGRLMFEHASGHSGLPHPRLSRARGRTDTYPFRSDRSIIPILAGASVPWHRHDDDDVAPSAPARDLAISREPDDAYAYGHAPEQPDRIDELDQLLRQVELLAGRPAA